MRNHLKQNLLFFIFQLYLSALFFVSCSQVVPEINSTDYSVIFDYSDDKSLPSARFSFFASSLSDVRRYNRIKITSVETGYCWDTNEIIRLENNELQWAGCTNLIAPYNEKLPCGIYEVTYYNSDEKECSVKINVLYDLDYYNLLLPALPAFMAQHGGIEKIAIYNKENILIYFGDRTEKFLSTRDIWNQYRDAAKYQIIWYAGDQKVICIEPKKDVKPELDD